MTTKLKAGFMYAQIENDVVVVGFADNEYNTNQYLLLQRTLCCTKQDCDLSLDKIHISYNDQTRSSYGGILNAILAEDSMELILDSETADALGTNTIIEVTFNKKLASPEIKSIVQLLFENDAGVLAEKNSQSADPNF